MNQSVRIIEISWEGPIPMEEVISKRHRGQDYGVYQLYGTHNVLGSDALLYIGKAQERPFGQRLREHRDEWVEWEPSVVNVYLGRLGGTDRMTAGRWPAWEEHISHAERLLIYFCAPPYNSSGLKSGPQMEPTVVLNHKRRHRLPIEVSTLHLTTKIDTPEWRVYGEDEPR